MSSDLIAEARRIAEEEMRATERIESDPVADKVVRDAHKLLTKSGIGGGIPTLTTEERRRFNALAKAGRVAGAGVVGGVTGLVAGGPAGVLPGAGAGVASEIAAIGTEEATGSGLAGAGAGLATDVGVSLLQRRPSGGLAKRAVNALRPNARSGAILAEGGLLDAVGREGPAEVAEALSRRYGELVDAEQAAWDMAKRANTDVTVSSAKLKKVAREVLNRTKGLPRDERPQAPLAVFGKDDFGDPIIPEQMTLEDAQTILSRISNDSLVAGQGGRFKTRSVGQKEMRRAVDAVLDDIARQSESGSEAAAALRTARSATAQKFAAIPEDSVAFKNILGPKAFDQPEKAFQQIIGSRQPVQEAKRIKALIAGDKAAERGLRRTAIQRVFGRVAGGTGEVAPRSAGAAASRAGAEEKVLREILGDEGFETVQKNLSKVFRASKKKPLLPEVLTSRAQGLSPSEKAGAALGAVAAYAFEGNPVTGGMAGAGAGFVIDQIASRFGPQAARLVALEALQRDEVMKQVVKAATKNTAPAERVLESLIRRGILTFTDFGDFEPQKTASPNRGASNAEPSSVGSGARAPL